MDEPRSSSEPQSQVDESLDGSVAETRVEDSPAGDGRAAEERAAEEHAAEAPVADDSDVSAAATDDAPATAEGGADAGAVEMDDADADLDDDDLDEEEDVPDRPPLELIEEGDDDDDLTMQWYILKVQVNREDSIRDALDRRIKIEGLERFFEDIVVPTEDVKEFTKSGKQRIVKRKLYPGYILVRMHINDDTWFIVRETPGIGDFTGSAGKPTPMEDHEVERILQKTRPEEEESSTLKTSIPYKPGDRVRVKEGHFENFEGEVEGIDETNGRVTVMINIFGRSTPVELNHWEIESV